MRRRASLAALVANLACGAPYGLDVGSDAVKVDAAAAPLDATTAADAAPPLSVTLVEQPPDPCDAACVELVAHAAGGVAPYTYQWGPDVAADGGVAVACPDAATSYTVAVTDRSGRAGELPTSGMTGSATVTVDLRAQCTGVDGGDDADAASVVYWADWQTVDAGTVSGVLALPTGAIEVSYSGALFGAQTSTGTDDFVPASTFTSPTVANAPPGPGCWRSRVDRRRMVF